MWCCSARKIEVAFLKSYESDPKSAFGGIVFLNRKVNSFLAKEIYRNFYEIIIAPEYDKKALEILMTKKKLILLKNPNIKKKKIENKSTLCEICQTIDLEL